MRGLTSVALFFAVSAGVFGGTSEISDICKEGAECSVEVDDIAQLQLHAGGKDSLSGRSELVNTQGAPAYKDASGSVIYNGMLCLVGGRGMQTIDCFQANESKWINSNAQTNDLHHVQPVVYDGKVWMVTGWTGPYGNETDITDVLVWDPVQDKITTGCSIPRKFRTGAAGVVNYDGRFVIVGGASGGHLKSTGAFSTPNMTVFDPASCNWYEMTSNKLRFKRDHFQAVLVGTKIVIAGGRDSPFYMDPDMQIFHQTEQTEFFDLSLGEDGTWVRVADMPVPRGGAASVVLGSDVYVLGGQTNKTQEDSKCAQSWNSVTPFPWIAHKDVHRYNVDTDTWTRMPDMALGRHAHGSAALPDKDGQTKIWTAGGLECSGAAPMTTSTERLR